MSENPIQRANEAQMLMDHPLLKEGFEKLRQAYLDAWLDSPPADTAGREKLWLMIGMLGKLQADLLSIMEIGKLARRDAEEANKAAQAAPTI